MTHNHPFQPSSTPVRKVLVSGGGPVGLSLALWLDELLGDTVEVTVCDGRWALEGGQVRWKNEAEGNARRQQVVTIQSRQFSKFPDRVQQHLFRGDDFTEMWPSGPDSIRGLRPRNIRISTIEDRLLELANESERITLRASALDPQIDEGVIRQSDIVAICEGSASKTRDFYSNKFGIADTSIYSGDGALPLTDVVLGLRVRSSLSDPFAVLLTTMQRTFLLNSLRGEGFLNMRLTEEEASEVRGVDLKNDRLTGCIQSRPCVMERDTNGEFKCTTHDVLFLPALRGSSSKLWQRIAGGLSLFGVEERHLTAVTAFRLNMVQRPRFSAEIYPGTYAFLLGDAANSIHFWPGRGLNCGLASALSLARTLSERSGRTDLRDADFVRHEGNMSMLQYRHKSRAWRAMVTTDSDGVEVPIKDLIAASLEPGDPAEKKGHVDILLERLSRIQGRLDGRLTDKMPSLRAMKRHIEQLDESTLKTLVASGEWDTQSVGGEEVDVDWLTPPPQVTQRPSKGSNFSPRAAVSKFFRREAKGR